MLQQWNAREKKSGWEDTTKRVIGNTILHPEHLPFEGNVMDRDEDLTQHQDVLLPTSALEILLPLPTLLTLAALANPALSS
jgi:hypothetical protein